MKTDKNINEMSNAINAAPSKATVRQWFNFFSLPIWTAIAMSISLGTVTQTARAEKTAGAQNSPIDRKNEPVTKPTDGKGALPTFAEADVNGDNYITKDELKNYPNLLQVFDKVDAGEDGQLEQHEYQNLITETKREGQVR